MIQTKRTEEDMIWSSIDSIAIEECLDSISMIEMKAYKYMTHMDELTDNEKADIIQYAKRCATQYGHGIHLMRSIASRFDDTDYREYDLDCEQSDGGDRDNQQIEKRNIDNEFSIIPNPNNGTFTILTSEKRQIKYLSIIDLHGKVVWENKSSNNEVEYHVQLNSGLYLISIEDTEGNINIDKMVISR